MRRDMDLVRKILIGLADETLSTDPNEMRIEGWDESTLFHHVWLMMQAGLLFGETFSEDGFGSPPQAFPYSLTWAGHEFLDAAREPGRWEQAKQAVGKIGEVSFAVWTAVLVDLTMKNLGLR